MKFCTGRSVGDPATFLGIAHNPLMVYFICCPECCLLVASLWRLFSAASDSASRFERRVLLAFRTPQGVLDCILLHLVDGFLSQSSSVACFDARVYVCVTRKRETQRSPLVSGMRRATILHPVPSPLCRWVIHEVLSSIGLSSSQEASSALLEEGFRRCELLEGGRGRLRRDASDAPAPIGSADVADGGSSGAVERALAHSSSQSVDGWGDDDLDIYDTEDEQKGSGGEQGRVTQRRETKERPEGVSQGASGTAGASDSGSSGGDGDGDGAGRSTRMVRKRLIALQNLFETNSMAEAAQDRDFDAMRLREFLTIGGSTDPEVNSRTDASMWGKADFRQKLLQTAVMKYARAGEVSAVGVLFERHPVETLSIRLRVLRYVRSSSGALL